ncbi:hypothetical protein RF11_04121 [Thelohanellus kitauei]|uniref:Uncharacterized protein n=1 Tax=Thelohanellus kitauei TaxID=669202 RepID=A0A0C2J9M0_THEKT|nr:hypothetical protein RF11_04121 [Thelohanellus kitauei]
MEIVNALCEKYQLTEGEIDQILVNFWNYVLEFEIEEYRDFLSFRKTTNKARIKETQLKRKLSILYIKYIGEGIAKHYQAKVKPAVSSHAPGRVSNWTPDELHQLSKNIDKFCQLKDFQTDHPNILDIDVATT